MILSEGKRDNQLLPYLEAMNAKTGKNMSLGEFKTMMLRKLSTEGSINNLSLQSNYYLVGAVKYYFQGYLTLNKDLSVYSNKENAQDTWNREVCQKLNILILMFRNGYIDSIGASWMEPEDFGEMPLPDLFKKYNAELKKVLSKIKKSEKEQENTPAFLGSETQIGKGYTADIIYSFSDSSRYKDATSPGAWCITYGENHLNYYTNRGNGHFVIFRKNGYEGVERKPNKGQWVGNKPQDDYGNSLIAYLQSNTGPGPANYDGGPLITSRWNHGYEFSCEADRAYSQADFERITGVGMSELKKIYEEWKYYKDIKSNKKTKSEQLTDDLIRKVKYAQMRINGGEDPNVLLEAVDKDRVWKDVGMEGQYVGALCFVNSVSTPYEFILSDNGDVLVTWAEISKDGSFYDVPIDKKGFLYEKFRMAFAARMKRCNDSNFRTKQAASNINALFCDYLIIRHDGTIEYGPQSGEL